MKRSKLRKPTISSLKKKLDKHPLLISKGFKPRKGMVIKCDNCDKEVYKHPNSIKNYGKGGRYCSIMCHIVFMKNKAFRLNCVICNKIFFCQPCQVKYRHRKTCSIKCRSKFQVLEANKRREAGVYTQHQMDRQARYCKAMIDARNEAFKRDNWTCQECGVRGAYLEADHIKPFAYFPELRFEIGNLRTLCRPCHDKTKISAKAMRAIYLNV